VSSFGRRRTATDSANDGERSLGACGRRCWCDLLAHGHKALDYRTSSRLLPAAPWPAACGGGLRDALAFGPSAMRLLSQTLIPVRAILQARWVTPAAGAS